MSSSVPGSARLVLASDVRHLNEPQAVFSAMLTGWQRQLRSRSLSNQTVDGRISLIRRFNEFAGSYPWAWTPGDMEDFTLSLMSGPKKAAPSTIRDRKSTRLNSSHVAISYAVFCLTKKR